MNCPVCGNDQIYRFFNVENVPIQCNLLWNTREEALAAPRGNISLGFCEYCGHIFNTLFDPAVINYDQQYENALYYSNVFNDYAEYLSKYLLDRYNLLNKSIIEIGCGQGHFLSRLCKQGDSRGLGFDPGYRQSESITSVKKNIKIIKDYYGEKYNAYEADLIYSRQVLEHVPEPYQFVIDIYEAALERGTSVFIEVPSAMFTLKEQAFWDIIYEHYSYFTKESITALFQSANFEIENTYDLYHEQFLGIEVKPVKRKSNRIKAIKKDSDLFNYVRNYHQFYLDKINYWHEQIKEWMKDHRSFIVWGVGSKGVMFLNELGISNEMPNVIDINPRKQGKFVTGTGQQIMSPDILKKIKPYTLIITNSIYLQEIKRKLYEMGLVTDIRSI